MKSRDVIFTDSWDESMAHDKVPSKCGQFGPGALSLAINVAKD